MVHKPYWPGLPVSRLMDGLPIDAPLCQLTWTKAHSSNARVWDVTPMSGGMRTQSVETAHVVQLAAWLTDGCLACGAEQLQAGWLSILTATYHSALFLTQTAMQRRLLTLEPTPQRQPLTQVRAQETISTSLFEARPFSACNTFSSIHLIMLDVNYMVWCCQGLPGIDLAAQLSQ